MDCCVFSAASYYICGTGETNFCADACDLKDSFFLHGNTGLGNLTRVLLQVIDVALPS